MKGKNNILVAIMSVLLMVLFWACSSGSGGTAGGASGQVQKDLVKVLPALTSNNSNGIRLSGDVTTPDPLSGHEEWYAFDDDPDTYYRNGVATTIYKDNEYINVYFSTTDYPEGVALSEIHIIPHGGAIDNIEYISIISETGGGMDDARFNSYEYAINGAIPAEGIILKASWDDPFALNPVTHKDSKWSIRFLRTGSQQQFSIAEIEFYVYE